MAVRYSRPLRWIQYDATTVLNPLVEAKAAVKALKTTPYQRDWVDKLQALQFKLEVAGTSRIEGAEFTERELDAALEGNVEEQHTRSQRQAAAAAATYRWIARLPDDRPIDEGLVIDIHRRMVTGCDDDHCEPGRLRGRDQNVTFGFPMHRGCEGGPECQEAFSQLLEAVRTEYRAHDPIVQAIGIHYHFAAMHPFQDGNGRTARALEALVLQRAGLRDTAFIAMSNYYYTEKVAYLEALTDVRAAQHDLTPLIVFALTGVAQQCERLLGEIKRNIHKAVFRNTMHDLFGRLRSPKKRVIAKRQLRILELLLDVETITLEDLTDRVSRDYEGLKAARRGLIRDLNGLIRLGAMTVTTLEEKETYLLGLNLLWPAEISESEFLDRVSRMPKAKTHRFL